MYTGTGCVKHRSMGTLAGSTQREILVLDSKLFVDGVGV